MKNIIILFVTLTLIVSCNSLKNIQTDYHLLKYPVNLNVITLNEWGSVPNSSRIKEHTIERITIHHGGVEFKKEKNAIEYIKNLQSWSRSEKKWMDIPYHFLIDLEGKIYEGRNLNYPGDTNTAYDPTGHLLICVLGNYEIQKINGRQLTSLTNLITYFCKNLNLNPETIKGHKDYVETACPGKDLYKYLEDRTIVIMVKDNLKKYSIDN